ncbi:MULTISPECIES: hypothetical protein [unclassified Streptomyces]|uniref:hypothetical protein n=1 Tax=unclassified Streptomyces TaxID=2593676 RepID=UPI00081B6E8B|nr:MULTISPECIES: hypothetical protein [unclassified Streptomyces]SCD67004.1 hypothetical protein GA0115234_1041295 [Streptomyces sp. DvalAA-43]
MARTVQSRARAALVIALGALCQGQLATGTAWADAPDGGMETHHGPSLITIDNSNADSWLEVDRTLNVLGPFSKGTAGSDHDGGGGAIDQNVSSSQAVGVQAAPDEQADEDDEDNLPPAPAPPESAATGGDDPEGDADHDTGALSAS